MIVTTTRQLKLLETLKLLRQFENDFVDHSSTLDDDTYAVMQLKIEELNSVFKQFIQLTQSISSLEEQLTNTKRAKVESVDRTEGTVIDKDLQREQYLRDRKRLYPHCDDNDFDL